MTTAFDPIVLGGTRLANRLVMAPMTRSRAHGPGAEPTALMATYYAQRAAAGLIVTEASSPPPWARATPTPPACTPRDRSAPGAP